MTKPKSASASGGHWVIVLRGKPDDLDEWRRFLQAPYDPFVEQLPGLEAPVLRCTEFEGMAPLKVYERARIIIDDLNGAIGVASRAGRVEYDGIAEVMADGTIKRSAFIEGAQFLILPSQIAEATTGGEPIPPGPTFAQKWLQIAAANETVADMLRHFGAKLSWYDLYKAYDGIAGLCGGEAALRKRPWAGSSRVTLFKRTANYYRHGHPHGARTSPPSNPMHIEEAREFIGRMIYAVMGEQKP